MTVRLVVPCSRFNVEAIKNSVKMRSATILVLAAYLATCGTATRHGADTTCDFSALSLDDEVSRGLARLPEIQGSDRQQLEPYVAGLQVGEFTMKGLNKLRRYGPLFPYCINGSRMLQVDFVNDGDIALSLPWKVCSGHAGNFSLRATFSRFTAQFRILESSGVGVKLELLGRIVPVATEGLRGIVDGAGSEVRFASQVLSAAFPSVVNEFWYWEFSVGFDRALRKPIE
ncbi:uncharacterized protein LOC142586971 [Dermacentor variabilis]|uniref:uncharacterized protein LOC142586971 n=1 Tax=Dermacentor variabilis TaxID=34621 RepID=UPI003F5B9C9D